MILIDGNGEELSHGERVYSFDFDGKKYYGTLYKNEDYPEVSLWYIKYDDGNEFAVLEYKLVFKA